MLPYRYKNKKAHFSTGLKSVSSVNHTILGVKGYIQYKTVSQRKKYGTLFLNEFYKTPDHTQTCFKDIPHRSINYSNITFTSSP